MVLQAINTQKAKNLEYFQLELTNLVITLPIQIPQQDTYFHPDQIQQVVNFSFSKPDSFTKMQSECILAKSHPWLQKKWLV